MDLIDREKALACFDGWYNPIRDEWHDVEEIPGYEKLEELPIVAEVEDIIRCKDCKHYISHCCYERNHIRIGLFVGKDEFCSWAERRQE